MTFMDFENKICFRISKLKLCTMEDNKVFLSGDKNLEIFLAYLFKKQTSLHLPCVRDCQ